MNRVFFSALRIAAIYMLAGGLWIFFSDALIEVLVDDVATMRWLQTWKGLAFILITGVLVFWMSWQALHRQQLLIRQLENYAFVHPLTGLPSRLAALQRIQRCLDRRGGVVVVSLDLDGFSAINDGFGHEVGDRVLQIVADRLQADRQPGEFVAHTNADEFVLVFDSPESPQALETRLDQVRAALARPLAVPGVRDLHVSASMGISLGPLDSRHAAELVRFAEAAVTTVKRRSPGSRLMFGPDIVSHASRQLAMEGDLRDALANQQLMLHYQPIYRGDDGQRIVAMEALLRWQSPDGQPISPAEFIPLAERTGLILEMGGWVIDQVCAQLAAWREAGLTPPPVALNLSPRQLEKPELLIEQLSEALQRHQVPPSLVTLEITESSLMQQGDAARELLQSLQASGLRIALDDFGTGYSSLSYLRDLPLNVLKIDRSFIAKLDASQSDHDLVKGIISLAEIFGLTVVAEGVETEAQQLLLDQMGCHCFQGFWFSKPLPPDEVPRLLAG